MFASNTQKYMFKIFSGQWCSVRVNRANPTTRHERTLPHYPSRLTLNRKMETEGPSEMSVTTRCNKPGMHIWIFTSDPIPVRIRAVVASKPMCSRVLLVVVSTWSVSGHELFKAVNADAFRVVVEHQLLYCRTASGPRNARSSERCRLQKQRHAVIDRAAKASLN